MIRCAFSASPRTIDCVPHISHPLSSLSPPTLTCMTDHLLHVMHAKVETDACYWRASESLIPGFIHLCALGILFRASPVWSSSWSFNPTKSILTSTSSSPQTMDVACVGELQIADSSLENQKMQVSRCHRLGSLACHRYPLASGQFFPLFYFFLILPVVDFENRYLARVI